MNPIEALITFLTPDKCLICEDEDTLLCEACSFSEIISSPSICYVCGAYSPGSVTCTRCRKTSPLTAVWVATPYEGAPKQLIYNLKFSSQRSAAVPMRKAMSLLVPQLDAVVTHLPTSPNRVRERGFDQAALIAKAIAADRSLRYTPLLIRQENVHQVGASKTKRKQQMKNVFRARSVYITKGRDIIIVDDVMTTGASLEAAAYSLKKAGARKVYGLVYAR